MHSSSLWIYSITAFRSAAILTWWSSETSSWAALFESRGIDLEKSLRKSRSQAMIYILYGKDFDPKPYEVDTSTVTHYRKRA